MKSVRTKTYSLQIPDEWEMQHSEDSFVSVYDPKGKGAITISSYSSETNTSDVVCELKKFARKDVTVEKTRVDGQDVGVSEYEDNENGKNVLTFSTAVSRPGRLLVASYHCNREEISAEELENVKKIFTTISLS